MDARTILERSVSVYSSCDSYSDRGKATVVMGLGLSEPTQTLNFSTQFVRPGKFRFEWSSQHPYFGGSGPTFKNLIWSDGKAAYSLLHISPEIK
jgi:hypothetical protein